MLNGLDCGRYYPLLLTQQFRQCEAGPTNPLETLLISTVPRDRARKAVSPYASESLQLINLDLEPCHEWVEHSSTGGSDNISEGKQELPYDLLGTTASKEPVVSLKSRIDNLGKPCRENYWNKRSFQKDRQPAVHRGQNSPVSWILHKLHTMCYYVRGVETDDRVKDTKHTNYSHFPAVPN